MDVAPSVPGPPDEADIFLKASVTDVRCRLPTATTCGAANNANGPDYSGSLLANETFRITDHDNGPTSLDAATVTDLELPFPVPCTETAGDPARGSSCSISTTMNSIYAGAIREKRAVDEIGQIFVEDGGADGVGTTESDNTVFLRQGIFIP
jgi:hypothetical protein